MLYEVITVSAGVKHPPAWLFPLRLLRLWKARPYLTTFRGLARPWAALEPYAPSPRNNFV